MTRKGTKIVHFGLFFFFGCRLHISHLLTAWEKVTPTSPIRALVFFKGVYSEMTRNRFVQIYCVNGYVFRIKGSSWKLFFKSIEVEIKKFKYHTHHSTKLHVQIICHNENHVAALGTLSTPQQAGEQGEGKQKTRNLLSHCPKMVPVGSPGQWTCHECSRLVLSPEEVSLKQC